MKVSIVRGGGIAGLVTVITVDSASLAPQAATELRARVERAGLSGPPERPGPPEGGTAGPDRFDYELTVEDGGRVLTTRAREGDLPGPLRALISYVTSLPERRERIGPPG
ncbi:protealysin inhibitor emfourin [Streptosporangium sp. NPDC023825]|uniref:protealysin inhibitor emfourin n=1 Tax=Streptosporangium sp. NPDC023825 TaxID=3154909 RepID=UPI0034213335